MKILSRKFNIFLSRVRSFLIILSAMLILFSSPRPAHAWGGRGHNTICEAAAFLVKNKELKEFLQLRPHIMGHLCNIPDIQWKNR